MSTRTPLRILAPLLLAPSALSQGAPLHTFRGTAAAERLGFAVALTGDVDGDGRGDVLVGSPYDPAGSVQIGVARVFSGASGALLHELVGDAALDHLGWSVASAGDVDGDGRCDLLAGAPDSDLAAGDAGLARIFSGANGGVLRTFPGAAAGERFGASVAGGADADLDGVPDVLAGAFLAGGGTQTGRYELRSGASGALLASGAGAAGDRLGVAVAFVGDLDGDGRADLAVGADQQASGGAGYVLLLRGGSGATLRVLHGAAAGDRFGAAVAAAGDVDLDGVPDVLVGAPSALVGGARPGAVLVHSGASGALLARHVGSAAGEGFGAAVAGAGDLDLDGRPDALVGAPFAGGTGRALVLAAPDGSVLRSFGGSSGGDRFGWSVAGGADLDLDGLPDLLVGAPYEDGPPLDAGAARVFSGADCAPQPYCTPKLNSQGCLPAVWWSGTLSLSGPDTFLAGASGLIAQQPGVFLHGLAPSAQPFQGGILCVQPPLVRSPLLTTGGGPGACSGLLSWHLTQAFAAAHGWSAGTLLHGQVWTRDPAVASGTSLSDALRIPLCP